MGTEFLETLPGAVPGQRSLSRPARQRSPERRPPQPGPPPLPTAGVDARANAGRRAAIMTTAGPDRRGVGRRLGRGPRRPGLGLGLEPWMGRGGPLAAGSVFGRRDLMPGPGGRRAWPDRLNRNSAGRSARGTRRASHRLDGTSGPNGRAGPGVALPRLFAASLDSATVAQQTASKAHRLRAP